MHVCLGVLLCVCASRNGFLSTLFIKWNRVFFRNVITSYPYTFLLQLPWKNFFLLQTSRTTEHNCLVEICVTYMFLHILRSCGVYLLFINLGKIVLVDLIIDIVIAFKVNLIAIPSQHHCIYVTDIDITRNRDKNVLRGIVIRYIENYSSVMKILTSNFTQ